MTKAAAEGISEAARRLGITVGVAESLTGGLLSSTLAKATAAADWFRGGIVAYSTEVKQDVLGVSPGPVITERCAAEMATGAAEVLGADLAVAVTGAGGPDPEEGQPPGTVWMAVSFDGRLETQRTVFGGDPAEVVQATCQAATKLVLDHLRQHAGSAS